MHTELAPPPASRHPRPARLRAWLSAPLRNDLLWLAACVFAMLAVLQLLGLAVERYYLPPLPAAARPHLTPAGFEQAGNAVLYRACVREARMRSLPVQPYPQEGESVSFSGEGGLLVKRTETLAADVNDMSVENGCQVKLRPTVRTDSAPAAGIPGALRRIAQARSGNDDALAAALNQADSEAPPCAPQQRAAPRSSYMLLKLCTGRHGPAAARPDAPRRQAARAIRLPAT